MPCRNRDRRHDDRLPAPGHEGDLRASSPGRRRTASRRRTSSSRSSTCSRTCPRRSSTSTATTRSRSRSARWTSWGIEKGLIGVGDRERRRASSRSSATPTGSSPPVNADPNEGMDGIREIVRRLREVRHPRRRLLPVGHVPAGRDQRQEDVPDLRQVRGARHPDLLLRRRARARASRWRRSTSSSSTRSCTTSPSSSSSPATAASRGRTSR